MNDLILILIFYLSIFSRIYPIRNMLAPSALDPILMGTISRLIVDNNGIPDSWEPYISTKLSYPPGFPSVIAWFNIISNVQIPTIILFFTNFIQALLPLGVYAFASVIFKNKFQSIAAAIIAMIAAYPAFTSGDNAIILLYFITIVTLAIIYSEINLKSYLSLVILFILSVTGFLVYSTYAFYLLLIIFAFFIQKFSINNLKKILNNYIILVLFLVLLPFLFTFNYYSQFYTKNVGQSAYILAEWNRSAEGQIPKQNDLINVAYSFLLEPFLYILDGKITSSFLELNVFTLYDLIFVFVFLASIFIVLRTKNKIGLVVILLYTIFILFSNVLSYVQLQVFPIIDKVPMMYYLRPARFSLFIFLPLSLLFSFFFIKTRNWIVFSKLNLSILILVILTLVGLYNIILHLSLVASSPLVAADQKNAFDWISASTPKNSRILNMIVGFDPGGFKGDAGQWIPAFTDRQIIFPPVSVFENVSIPEIQERLQLMRLIDDNKINTPEFKSLTKKFNINYVFLTDRYVFFDSKHKISDYEFKKVNPVEFLNVSDYKLVFQLNQTYVFQVIQSSL